MPRPCADRHPEPKTDSSCGLCRLYLNNIRYFELWNDEPGVSCIHLGKPTGEKKPCQACGHRVLEVDLYQCARHGLCVRDRQIQGVPACCRSCPDKVSRSEAMAAQETSSSLPSGRQGQGNIVSCLAVCQDVPGAALIGAGWPIRLDEQTLPPLGIKKRFNASLVKRPKGNGWILAYRDGWKGSEVHLQDLKDITFSPIGPPRQLALFHPQEANYGREDPRLFVYKDRVHVSYSGVVGGHSIRHTSVLYARLTQDCSRVEQLFCPRYGRRNLWEKNWSFFEHEDTLYCVYGVATHRILRIEGERADLVYDTPTPLLRTPGSGEMRGGAPPVLLGGEYWHFYHDRTEKNGLRTYRIGLYTFEARPPFRMTRYVRGPLMTADASTRPPDQYASVVFPCGAAYRPEHDDWLVSMGVHDRWTEIHRFSRDDLEKRLLRLSPPSWWSWDDKSAGTHDPAIFAYVSGDIDEYRLDSFEPGLVGSYVLDVGSHIGSFAYAARKRGAALVHCYEPVLSSFERLKANAERMGGVVPHRWAVTGRASSGEPFISPEGAPETSLEEVINKLAEASLRGKVDLLKIDCEGAEWAMFRVTPPSVIYEKVDRIVGEYHCVDHVKDDLPEGVHDDASARAWMLKYLKETLGFSYAHAAPDQDGRGWFFAHKESPRG